MRQIKRRAVDFPAPLAPMRAYDSPSNTSKETRSRASLPSGSMRGVDRGCSDRLAARVTLLDKFCASE